MSYDYSENQLIQESSGELLRDELGWEVKLAYNEEKLGINGTFGRKSYKDILLTKYFRNALKKFNPWINETQLDEAEKSIFCDDEFRRVAAQHRSAVLDKNTNFEKEEENYILSLLKLNEEKYFLIRDGIPVNTVDANGRKTTRHAMVIDFANPANNKFLAIKELKIHGELYHRRTDIVGFVNGIPLLFVELKRNDIDVQNAFTDNYSDYLDTIPHLFYYNAFLILSNGGEAKVGTIGSKYEFFHEWKRLAENDTGNVALETMLRGICRKENFLDLLENFILYDHSNGTNVKILARNHQYLGVNEAVKAYEARKINNGKLGVFWHTQGSGKSYSMLFLAKKIRRKFTGKSTIIILTDRDELNKQISDTFENCGILGKVPASRYMATSGENLIQKIKDNSSFIFTLIQKFNKSYETPLPIENDIIVMSDEAHRSQYGIFADNMMKLIPNAARIGFTGTPLLSSDNITERTFGSYVSLTKTFLNNKGFNLQNLVEAKGFQKVELIQIAASSICETIESKKTFSTYAVELRKVVKYLDKHDITDTTLNEYDAIRAIHKALQEKRKHVDDTDLMVEINSIINDYIKIETPKDGEVIESRQFDISSIDFEILHREFSKSKKKNLALKDLQDVVQQQLNKMLLANPNRMDYYDRYQKIIDAYNKEQNQATIEKTFMDLMNLASKLDQEEQRYIREGFSNNEELAVYDMLFRNDLNSNDIKKIKRIASELLVKLKAKIGEYNDWTRKEVARAEVAVLIRNTLYELPETYDESSISEYRNKIYDYVVTRYSRAA